MIRKTRAPSHAPTPSPTNTHIAVQGANLCDYGAQILEENCLMAAIMAMPPTNKHDRTAPMKLTVHTNSSTVPTGCSVYTPSGHKPHVQADPNGPQEWDAQFNQQPFTLNDGNYSLICSALMVSTKQPTFAPTSYAPTHAPSLSPSIGPSFSPTITPGPTSSPSNSPSYAPSLAPTLSPTSFPTSSSISQAQLDFHKERASKTRIATSITKAKQSAIRERVDAIKRQKQTANMKIAISIQSSLDAKRSALLLLIQKTHHMNEACKGNATLPEAELKLELHQIRLSPAAVTSALHKVAILKSIRNALFKLQRMRQLNGAHSVFALKKVSENLVFATKEVETKSKSASKSMPLG